MLPICRYQTAPQKVRFQLTCLLWQLTAPRRHATLLSGCFLRTFILMSSMFILPFVCISMFSTTVFICFVICMFVSISILCFIRSVILTLILCTFSMHLHFLWLSVVHVNHYHPIQRSLDLHLHLMISLFKYISLFAFICLTSFTSLYPVLSSSSSLASFPSLPSFFYLSVTSPSSQFLPVLPPLCTNTDAKSYIVRVSIQYAQLRKRDSALCV